MTDPSQYFKGRTVQEQMTEVIGYVDTRAAEVATDAIASDVAQVHQDMLDADADASAAAASAAAAAGTLANAVKKTGESSQSIAGDIAISGALSVSGAVTVPAPVNNTDAATKKYVDDHHDASKISITDINSYAVGLTGNQSPIAGTKTFTGGIVRKTGLSLTPGSYSEAWAYLLNSNNDETIGAIGAATTSTNNYTMLKVYDKTNPSYYTKLSLRLSSTGKVDLILESNTAQGYNSQTLATFGS